jgi:hypothetical protein
MARFDKVKKLAYACFTLKAGWLGYVRAVPEDNYIGVVICSKSGETITDMIYNPKQKFLKIMTFDKDHIEEDNFSGLLKNLGVKSEVELREISGLSFLLPHSPSGRVEDEIFEDMRRFDALDRQGMNEDIE